MSLLRMSKNRRPGSAWGRIFDSLFHRESRLHGQRKARRLLIDQLEERTLLSVSTPQLEAYLVNQAISDSQETVTASSLAMDKDGDFAVVWSRVDPVLDEAGDPVIDPATGNPMTDENVYARFFTNEVQRIVLPEGVLDDADPSSLATFSITVGGNEVQELSFGTTTPWSGWPIENISGEFKLQYVDGDGIDHETVTISFNEEDFNSGDPATDPALLIQDALRSLGGDLEDAVVTAVDSQHYHIAFGDASEGRDVNLLTVIDQSWTAGTLPGAIVSEVSEPFTYTNIAISPTNPNDTITAIETAFTLYYENYFTAGNRGVQTTRAAIPTVEATSVKTAADPEGLRTFNIEFTGDTSYKNVPTIVIAADSVLHEDGTPLNAEDILGVTIKETGDEFRVNPEEPDNPYTQLPDKYTQTSPGVAMNAEGNFVIVWESEVPESQNNGSETDIFARIYQAVGFVDTAENPELNEGIMTVDMDADGERETAIQGVRLVEAYQPYSTILEEDDPLRVADDLYTFRANVNTSSAQGNPSVGMDAVGNFTISWSDSGQPISFFNGINMRQFSYDGTPRSAVETTVNAEDTEIHDNSYTAMSDSGYALIVWESYVGPITYLYGELYDPEGYVVRNQWLITTGATQASASFDSIDNYAISWTQGGDLDIPAIGLSSAGVYFVEYNIGGGLIRGLTRANSATTAPDSTLTTWHNVQSGSQIVLDADGDMTVVYSGYGPDTNNYFFTSGTAAAYLQDILGREENEDLIALWPELADVSLPFGGNNSGDIDGEIEEVLISAQKEHGFNDEQLGRLRTILETIADLARGEANGVMYSQFDADPNLGVPNVLASDVIVNSQRDGNNARASLVLASNIMGGSFVIAVANLLNGGVDYIEVEPAYMPFGEDEIIDPAGTEIAIQNALNNSPLLSTPFQDAVVRWVQMDELMLREDTYWTLPYDPVDYYVYEITFINNFHDTPIAFAAFSIDLITKIGDDEVPAEPPIADLPVQGFVGTEQGNASVGMTPEGDYVVAYTEYGLNGAREVVASNVYYRYYDEAVDTAGPTVTSVKTPDGINIAESPIVNQEERLSYIILTLSEEMYDNLTGAADAVTNPENYRLTIAGEEVEGAISEVYYGLGEVSELAQRAADDPTTYGDFDVLSTLPSISWEVVLVVDANGALEGTPALGTGSYRLEVLAPSSATLNDPLGESGLRDASGNRLNRTGFYPDGYDHVVEFTLVVEEDPSSKEGLEVRVNETIDGVQTTTASSNEEYTGSTRCVAADSDGDFVVVWVSENQDGDDAGVYMRMFDSEGNPLTGETLVNTYTAGDQLECAVAMDADGDFVVVWASEAQDDLDDSWGIYGQRFDSMGRTVGEEFQINSNTPNDQVAPSVAMDREGNFVVVWASQGQSYSYFNDIRAQVYDTDGERVGSEIRINSQNIPGTGTTPSSNELHPSVDVSEVGTFVVSWTAATEQKNGVTTDSAVIARLFTYGGTPITIPEYEGHEEGNLEFKVNVGDDEFIADYEHIEDTRLEATRIRARNAQATMSPTGEFIVAWEAFQDNDWIDQPQDVVNSYGIYYRQYNVDGTPKVEEKDFNANQVVTALHEPPQYYSMLQSALYYGDQISPSIAVDADGDFYIAWAGNGSSTRNPLHPESLAAAYNHDDSGVFVRAFRATESGDETNPAVSPQARINTTYIGDQASPTVAVTPSGDYIVVWSGKGGGDTQGVYFTFHKSDTDTAGPMVTDFLLPDGKPVADSGQITQPLAAVVVTFDEDMYDNATHTGNAVTNPANYSLLVEGVEVAGGVSQVFYGLDVAYTLSPEYGLNTQQTNKYQAVLIVDANGAGEGVEALTDGQYQIVVKGSLRDAAGNPIFSTGQFPNGAAISEVFYVEVPTGQETLVSDGVHQIPPEGQYTYASTADPVASDADGDYVVAWTDNTTGREGVWFKMYERTSTLESDGSRSTFTVESEVINPDTGLPWTDNEVLVSSSTSARDISVARDVDGDFVVTWSDWSAESSWDVYAQRFDAAGQPTGEIFRVNSTTADVQQSSAVAMDAQGNFVITWQSNEQDGDLFGIYAQAYNAEGRVVGGVDEVQAIEFTKGFTGSFKLRWDHDNNPLTPDKVTSNITYNGNASAVLDAIRDQLTAIGADVRVIANGLTEVLVVFTDASGDVDQPPLWIAPADVLKTGGQADAQVVTKTLLDGESGEFLVNETTEGNQMYADVAMDASGDFIITWTSYGQDADAAVESNIYAKRYTSSSQYWDSANFDPDAIGLGNSKADFADEYVTTIDDPNNHLVEAGAGFEGVVQVLTVDYDGTEGGGSGSLLVGGNDDDGYWILTAAHVVWSVIQAPLSPSLVEIAFDTTTGRVIEQATEVIVHPAYNDNVELGNDVALVKIDSVPEGVEGFQIYTASDEVGETFQLLGYGAYGTGAIGEVFDSDDQKREMHNIYDATGAVLGYSDTQLAYDFDDGTTMRDAFGVLYGIRNTDDLLVTLKQEGMACHGDSGGPNLIDGLIAGVVSFGFGVPGVDINQDNFDSTYGEFGVDTRVSAFADWIDGITGCLSASELVAHGEFLVNSNDVFNLAYDEGGNLIPDPNDPESKVVCVAFDNQSGNQSHSSVAMDSDGDFVITWTSYGQDGVGSGYGAGVDGLNGVFARRYNADTTQASDVFQVNQTAEGNQQNARVSMDADGDFTVVWESDRDGDFDIHARRYAATRHVEYTSQFQTPAELLELELDPNSELLLTTFGHNPLYVTDALRVTVVYTTMNGIPFNNPPLGAMTVQVNNGAIGGEWLINTTTDGQQRFPGVAVDDAGDAVIVWSGNGQVPGQQDSQGIFLQRSDRTEDAAGPSVGNVYNVVAENGTTILERVAEGTVFAEGPTQFVITFGEALSTQSGSSGAGSVLNLENWQLSHIGGVTGVEYGLNAAYNSGLASTPSNKYEVVLTFDGNLSTAGNQALTVGAYNLTIFSYVEDLFGNGLDGAYTGMAPAADFVITFTVGTEGAGEDGEGEITPPGEPDPDDTDNSVNNFNTRLADGIDPAVAVDADGDYVVVWNSNRYNDGGDVVVRRFDKYGQPIGLEFSVTPHTSSTNNQGNIVYSSNGIQSQAAVAMDDYGTFVVVWSGEGDDDQSGIYARVYDKTGTPVGKTFLVNQYTQNIQSQPSVAMEDDGDFVVTWTSYGQDGDLDGVYGRRFNVQGAALGNEFRVNATTVNRQDRSDVAVDDNGDFVVVWRSDQQDGNTWGIYGQRFSADGTKLGGEFRVNTHTLDDQIDPAVAMDADGDYVVAWSSMSQDGSGYGVYARRYSAAGAAQTAAEFRVNQTTLHWQVTPDVGMAADGDFTVTWSSFQDMPDPNTTDLDYGIYARMYNADGTDFQDAGGTTLGEYRVNAIREGNQVTPAVGVSPAGKTVVAWAGPITPAANTMSVFARIIDPAKSAAIAGGGPTISAVVPSEAQGIMTWNASDPDGVARAHVMIDGVRYDGHPMPQSTSIVNFWTSIKGLSDGDHEYTIVAVDKAGNTSQKEGSFTFGGGVVGAGPVISAVVPSEAQKVMTWNASDPDGVASAFVTIDGVKYGGNPVPQNTTSVSFWWSLDGIGDGTHEYTITAVDKAGNATQKPGSFTFGGGSSVGTGPVISAVVPSEAQGIMTWNASDADGVASAYVMIEGVRYDGVPVPQSATSVNFWTSINLGAGTYDYTITAVDKAGNSSQKPGSFTFGGGSIVGAGPVISAVVPSEAKKVMTWNASDADGVASAYVMIEGVRYDGASMPQSATSVNFWTSIANLSTGTYDYTITAVDKAGNTTQKPGSFTFDGDGSSVSARKAVYGKLAKSSPRTSVKLDWLYDLEQLESRSDDNEESADAVDAVMATY